VIDGRSALAPSGLGAALSTNLVDPFGVMAEGYVFSSRSARTG
jgi:hypothetical protein